jgi:hypothetical protein
MTNYKKLRTLSICLFIFFSITPLINVFGCTSPDNAGAISGKNTTCYGQKVTFIVPAIGFATTYKWKLPAGTQIVSGSNSDTITVIFNGSGGDVRVQGVNTCDTGISSVINVKVYSLPKITLISSQKYCCDYGNIDLGSSTFASPTGGSWSCRQNQNLISSNVFQTAQACNPAKSGTFSLYYTYQDPTTSCINKDSTNFSINPLPAVLLKDGTFCQDKNEVTLKTQIIAPINLNALAAIKWKLLKTLPKTGGGNNTINDLVYDADATLNFDFRLKVDAGTIDLGTKTKDSIILEITIQDGAGCFNKDTATFTIVKVPSITMNSFPELCINAGKGDLTKISNTQPQGGCWSVINKSGYSNPDNLKIGLRSCDTLNTFFLNPQKGNGLYWMRYTYNSGGCIVIKEMKLHINPRPNVSLSLTPNGDGGKYCELDDDVTLNASPAGGTWTSSVAGIISGSTFMPGSVGVADRDKNIFLWYTYIHPTTKCDTSKSLIVFVQSTPRIQILTQNIDTCRRDPMIIKLTANSSYTTSKISWVHSFNSDKASFENKQQLSNSNPATFTIQPRKDSITFIRITAFTEAEGVCPFTDDMMDIRIDTLPCKSATGIRPIGSIKPFEVVLFPNPAKDKFNIEIHKAGKFSLKLYTTEGQLLLEKELYGFELNTITQKLTKGLYTLIINNSSGNSIIRKLSME